MKKLYISLLVLANLLFFSCERGEKINPIDCKKPEFNISVDGSNVIVDFAEPAQTAYEAKVIYNQYYSPVTFSLYDDTIIENLYKGNYTVSARQNCNNLWGEWSSEKSFTVVDGASLDCYNPSNLDYSVVRNNPNYGYDYYFTWYGDNDYYDVEVGLTGFRLGTGTRIRTSSTSVKNSLSSKFENGKTYDFYVRGYCGTNYSSWVGPKSIYVNSDHCGIPAIYYVTKSTTQINFSFESTTGLYDVSLSESPTTPSDIDRITFRTGRYTNSGTPFDITKSYYLFVRTVCPDSTVSDWNIKEATL